MLRAPTITDWLEVRVLPSPPHSLSNRKISRTRPRSPQLAGICGCVSVSADSFSGLNAFLGRFVSYLQLLVDQSQIEQWQSRMLSCVCIVNEIVASSHRSAFRAQKRDVSVTCALGSAIPNRIQRRLIYLSLSWADAVSHDCTAHAQRFLHSLSRISRSLVLHLGVELGSDQDHDDRKPDPDHEADSGT